MIINIIMQLRSAQPGYSTIPGGMACIV